MDVLAIEVLATAAALAFVHTVLGPDHTVPFVLLARAGRWSRSRTLLVTLACGAGHVASSLGLGLAGLALGYGVGQIEAVEGLRGGLAAWALVAFGSAYALWGLRQGWRWGRGIEVHEHHGRVHVHARGARPHHHASPGVRTTGFWAMFLVFVLGPCEPLIPLFVLPASRGLWGLALLTGAVFAIVTLATMVALVGLAWAGIERLPLGILERWSHAMAGGVIAASGLAVIFLGL